MIVFAAVIVNSVLIQFLSSSAQDILFYARHWRGLSASSSICSSVRERVTYHIDQDRLRKTWRLFCVSKYAIENVWFLLLVVGRFIPRNLNINALSQYLFRVQCPDYGVQIPNQSVPAPVDARLFLYAGTLRRSS